MEVENLFADLPDELPEERIEALVSGESVRIERIVSRGHRSPEGSWFDQEGDEWVMLLRGSAGLEIEGQTEILDLAPGDWVRIPAGCRHRVAWTAAGRTTVWLAVHFQA